MHDVLKVDGINDSTVASLRLSLEVSIKSLEKENSQSLQFFFLIGLLPGGVYEQEFKDLWGIDWEKHIKLLCNYSLVQKKDENEEKYLDDDNDESMAPETQRTNQEETQVQKIEKIKYTLPPYMSNYAEAKITEEDRLQFQYDICNYYATVCKVLTYY